MSAWTDATLCTDSDLTTYESRMPEAAKKVAGGSGQSAYDGKRAVAKDEIGARLERRGTDPDGLTRPAQLRRCAIFLELALIFRDMAQRNDNIAADKAAYYDTRADDELDGLALEWTDPGEAAVPTRRAHIWMRRS